MSEFAGNLPWKFFSFRHLGVESNAHKLPKERQSENLQDVAESIEANTVEVGETNLSPAKVMSVFPNVPVPGKNGMSEEVEKDHELTIAEKDCVLTSSDDDIEDLSAFVAERLQCLSEGSVEKLIMEECVNVEEILCGDVGVEKDGGGKSQSVCPDVTTGENVDVDDRRFSPDMEVDQMLREELGSGPFTARDAAVFSGSRMSELPRLWCLMWLVGMELLEALDCRKKVLVPQVKVFLKVS